MLRRVYNDNHDLFAIVFVPTSIARSLKNDRGHCPRSMNITIFFLTNFHFIIRITGDHLNQQGRIRNDCSCKPAGEPLYEQRLVRYSFQ